MNKFLIALGVVVLAVVVWMAFQPDTIDYVREVNDEVAELETELAEIEAAMEAGTLTSEQAAEAQVRIAARIDAINTSASAGQKSKLTDAQRAELAAGLLRLADALKSYQATLVAVDASVMELPEADRPVLRRGGGGSGKVSLAVIADEALETVEEQVDEIIEEITDEELSEEVSDSADETLGDDDEMSTTTDETMPDDTDNMGDDSVNDEETSDSDDAVGEETGEDAEDDEPMVDVSIEAEAGFGFDESANDDSTETTP